MALKTKSELIDEVEVCRRRIADLEHEQSLRKQVEAELRNSERSLADLFENAPVGMHCVGPDGVILRANKAELNLLGFERNEYVGRHISEFHEDQEVIADILTRLQSHETLCDYRARLRCKDGSVKHVLINSK